MSFPAYRSFRGDERVTPSLMRVYERLCEHLDFVEPRECKLGWLGHLSSIGREHVSRALTHLVAWGYLLEHERQPNCPRRFTLTHSVRDDLRRAA